MKALLKHSLLFFVLFFVESSVFAQTKNPGGPLLDLPDTRRHQRTPEKRDSVHIVIIFKLSEPWGIAPVRRRAAVFPHVKVEGLDRSPFPKNPFSAEYAIAKGYFKKLGFPKWDCWP